MLTTLFFASLLTGQAFAEPDAEKYLLGHIGVRVDLPRGWKPVTWADWALHAETSDKAVMLRAWGTPIQAVPTEADLPSYSNYYPDQVVTYGVKGAKTTSMVVGDLNGRAVVRGVLDFTADRIDGRVYTVAFPVDGQMFHMATISAARVSARAERALDEIAKQLDVRKAPAAVEDGGIIEAEGVRIDLPAGWRKPLESELGAATKQIDRLPVKDITPCSLAIHPRGVGTPDLMVTCQGGLQLGIIDEYSFEDEEKIVRPLLFGDVKVEPGVPLPLSDRMGFLYFKEVAGRGIATAVVPYDQGVARMWVLGPLAERAWLEESAKGAMAGATFSGPHPMGPDQFVAYWLTYRPTHPGVWGSGLCCVLGAIAVILGFTTVAAAARKRAATSEDYG